MASQLKTNQFSYHMASAFANSFLNDSIYMYIGRSSQWEIDEDAATPPATDVHTDHIDIWNHMAGAVRISRNEVALGIKTHNWASGVIYEKYVDDSTSLGAGTGYYVLAGFNNRCVYKCLDNNGGEGSTSKPTHKYQTSLRESDGYIWKYMYEMSVSEAADFNSAEATFVPYSGRGTSSGPGSILNIVVPANNSHGIGKNYRGSGFSNGTIGVPLHPTANIGASILSACNELILRSHEGGLSDADDFYSNCSIMLTSGYSQGKVYNVNGYIASSKTLTVTPNVDRATIGDTFKIGPKITVVGDGAGLTAIGNVNGFGNLTSITVATIGSGYSNLSSVSVEGNYFSGDDGEGATAEIYVPPSGGHGANPAPELGAKYATAVGKLPLAGGSNDGDGYFAGYGQKYRHVGLLRNPLTTDSSIARGKSYDLRTHLYFDSTQLSLGDMVTTFKTYLGPNAPSVVTNANTGATGVVWNISKNLLPGEPPGGSSESRWHVTIVNVVANSGLTFSNGQYVSTPEGSAYISSANLDQFSYKGNPPISSALPGQLDKYSGEIIYHEDNPPNFIAQNSQDNIQLIFEF